MNPYTPVSLISDSLTWPIVVLILAIITNAFFAASEIAFISLNKSKVRKLAEDGDRIAGMMLSFIDEPGRFLSTIQIGVTLAGFMASAFAAVTFAGPAAEWIRERSWCTVSESLAKNFTTIFVTMALSFVMLIFGELVPKRIAVRYSEWLARTTVKPLKFISTITSPFVTFLDFSTNLTLKLLRIKPDNASGHITEEEIRMMVDLGGASGTIEPQEKEMIENVFEFNNKTADEIMVHRKDIIAISIDIGEAECREMMRDCEFTRIPVYEGTIDNIQGILNTRDYLIKALDEPHPKIRELIRKPFFVPETILTDLLFRQMQKNKHSIAVVLDEFGGTSGIVSMEDLLEEIVGEIYDEYDVNDVPVKIEKLSDNDFRMQGETDIDAAAEVLGIEIDDEDFNTIGGFVFAKLNHVPVVGTKLEVPELFLEFTVEKMDGHRVDTVLVRKVNKPETGNGEEGGDD
ncbi:MAG: HlyC/CorC family transporter [Lentisphaerae bacterium]|nr:HlyC/CorC family transporter [Lentisphaerota bacterium]